MAYDFPSLRGRCTPALDNQPTNIHSSTADLDVSDLSTIDFQLVDQLCLIRRYSVCDTAFRPLILPVLAWGLYHGFGRVLSGLNFFLPSHYIWVSWCRLEKLRDIGWEKTWAPHIDLFFAFSSVWLNNPVHPLCVSVSSRGPGHLETMSRRVSRRHGFPFSVQHCTQVYFWRVVWRSSFPAMRWRWAGTRFIDDTPRFLDYHVCILGRGASPSFAAR